MKSSIVLTGPTASGKSSLAVELALELSPELGTLEIINADSLLFYRGMDIGTAKPTRDEMAKVPHHLIDIRDPDQNFTAGEFVSAVDQKLAEIHARGNRALIVGGSGFYLKALLLGLWEGPKSNPEIRARIEAEPSQELYRRLHLRDPETAYRVGINDRYRLIRSVELLEMTGKTPTELQAEHPAQPDPRFELWSTDRDDEELKQRISARAKEMLEAGFIEEVTRVRARYPSARPLGAVGYSQVCDFMDGKLPEGRKLEAGLPGLLSEIELATRQLVKSQRTWLKSQKPSRAFILDQDRPELKRQLLAFYALGIGVANPQRTQ